MGCFVDVLIIGWMDDLVDGCEYDEVGGLIGGLVGGLGSCDDLVSGFVGFFFFLEQLIFLS
jgi:hypothetical protein